MPIPYRAVLFDFDGTLADSYDAITASVNHVRSVHGLPPLPQAQVRGLVGHGILQLMADIVPGGDPAADAEIYRQHHPLVMYAQTRLLPGVADALAELYRRGVKLAVCSNKPVEITRKLLEALGVSPYFDAALGPEDAGKPKPYPEMIWLALKKLDVSKEQAFYIGDMEIDVETARNAGVEDAASRGRAGPAVTHHDGTWAGLKQRGVLLHFPGRLGPREA
jgi:HAD superfamily hydrolase (TIGR01549 family)